MTEIVPKSEVYHLSQEYQRTWKELLNLLLAKIRATGRNPASNVTVKVGERDVYKSAPDRKPVLNNLQPEHIQKVQTAFQNPSRLQGSVSIFIGEEKIFHVQNGRVLRDDLQLLLSTPTPNETESIELHLDTRALQARGQNIVTCAKQLLNSFRNRKEINQASDGTLCYTSGCYIFSCRGERVAVVSQETGKVVLNNDGFTDKATEADIRSLQKVELAAAKLRETEQIQQHQQIQENDKPTFGLKLK